MEIYQEHDYAFQTEFPKLKIFGIRKTNSTERGYNTTQQDTTRHNTTQHDTTRHDTT